MKSDRIKKVLLVVLVVIALYIWWGNLKLFYPASDTSLDDTPMPPSRTAPEVVQSLEYSPPRVNPFLRYLPQRAVGASAGQPTKPVPVKLSQSHRLVGTVGLGRNSQAVIMDASSAKTLLAVGDTVVGWQLVEIRDNLGIFKQGKLRDTLRIGVSGL